MSHLTNCDIASVRLFGTRLTGHASPSAPPSPVAVKSTYGYPESTLQPATQRGAPLLLHKAPTSPQSTESARSDGGVSKVEGEMAIMEREYKTLKGGREDGPPGYGEFVSEEMEGRPLLR